MLIRNLKFAVAAMLFAALGACDGGAVMGPEETTQSPIARTACMAGGEVAIRAGCPEVIEGEQGNQMDKFRRLPQPE